MADLGKVSLEVQVKTEDVRRAVQDYNRLAEAGKPLDAVNRTLTSRMAALSNAAKALASDYGSIRRGTTDTTNAMLTAARAVRTAESALDSARKTIKKYADDTDGAAAKTKTLGTSIQQLHGSLSTMRGLLAALGIGEIFREFISVGNQFQQVRQILMAVYGDSTTVDRKFQEMAATARAFGLDLTSVSMAYSRLTIASKGTALEGAKADGLFRSLAEAMSVLHMNAQQTQNTLRAFEEMISRGSVQSQQLRRQLATEIPGAFQIFVRAFNNGKPATAEMTEEFEKLMKQGKIATDDILPKVAAELHKTFGSGMIEATKSAQFATNQMQLAFKMLVNTGWQNGMQEAVRTVAAAMESMFSSPAAQAAMVAFGQTMAALAHTMFDLKDVIAPLTLALGSFFTIFTVGKALTAFVTFLGAVRSGPGAFAAVSAAVIGVASAFGMFITAHDKAAEAQKNLKDHSDLLGKTIAEFQNINYQTAQSGGAVIQSFRSQEEAARAYTDALEKLRVKHVDVQSGGVNLGVLAAAGLGTATTASLLGSNKLKMSSLSMGSMIPDSLKASFGANMEASAASVTKVAAGLGMAELAAGRAAAAVTGLAGAMAVARTAATGLLAALGGWPGIIIGVLTAVGLGVAQFMSQRKAALTLTSEEQSTLSYLNTLGKAQQTKGGLSDDQLDKVKEFASIAADAAERAQKLQDSTDKLTGKLKAQLDNSKGDIQGWRDLMDTAFQSYGPKLAEVMRTFDGGAADAMEKALSQGNVDRAADLVEKLNKVGGFRGPVKDMADAFVYAAHGLKDAQDKTQGLADQLKNVQSAAKQAVESLRQMGVEGINAAAHATRFAALPTEIQKLLTDNTAADTVKYGGKTGYELKAAKLQDFISGASKPGAVDSNGHPYDKADIDRARDQLKIEQQAAQITAGVKDARTAGARGVSRDEAYAAIMSVLDPLDGAYDKVNADAERYALALTKGKMNAGKVQELISQYKAVRNAQVAEQQAAAKDAVMGAYYKNSPGGAYRAAQMDLEHQLLTWKVAATKAGMPIDEINTKISTMRLDGMAKIATEFHSMADAAEAAATKTAEMADTLKGLKLSEYQKIIADYNKELIDADKDTRDLFNKYQDAMKKGEPDALQQFMNGMSSISQRRGLAGQSRDARIADLRKEGDAYAIFMQRLGQFGNVSEKAAEQYAKLYTATGSKGISQVSSTLAGNSGLLASMYPSASGRDLQLLLQVPALLAQYGSTLNNNLVSPLDKARAIADALIEAQKAADSSFQTGGRADRALTPNEIGKVASKAIDGANGSALISLHAQRAQEVKQVWTNLADDLTNTFTDVFSFNSQIKSIRDFLGQVTQMVLKAINQIIAVNVIKPFITSALAGMGLPITPSAMGNVFEGGRLHKFATGGVLSGPTLFPMSGGLGLAGEAGPEAIVPLARTRSGHLGVRMSGGMSAVNSVSVENNITIQVEGTGQSDQDIALAAKRARDTIEGIAANTYLEMSQNGNGNNSGVKI